MKIYKTILTLLLILTTLSLVNCSKIPTEKIYKKPENKILEPFIERRKEFESRPEDVKEILHEGTKRANQTAKENMNEIIEKMGLYIP